MTIIEQITHVIFHTKIGGVIASITGVICMAIIWKPKAFAHFKTYELVIALVAYGAVGGFFLVGAVTDYFGFYGKPDYALATGFTIGMCIIGIANLLASLFKKMESENKDITDLVNEIKKVIGKDD